MIFIITVELCLEVPELLLDPGPLLAVLGQLLLEPGLAPHLTLRIHTEVDGHVHRVGLVW